MGLLGAQLTQRAIPSKCSHKVRERHAFPRRLDQTMLGLDYAALAAFLQVIMIDLVLAGDNAIVIGMAAAGLAPDMRRQAILIGILAATVLRIIFALMTTWLMG